MISPKNSLCTKFGRVDLNERLLIDGNTDSACAVLFILALTSFFSLARMLRDRRSLMGLHTLCDVWGASSQKY